MAGVFEHEGSFRIADFGIDAEIPLARALILFGPNDCGKTNTLRAIAELLGDPAMQTRDEFRRDTLREPVDVNLGLERVNEHDFNAVSFTLDLSTRDGKAMLYRLTNNYPLDDKVFGPRKGLPLLELVNRDSQPPPDLKDELAVLVALKSGLEDYLSDLKRRQETNRDDLAQSLYDSLVTSYRDALDGLSGESEHEPLPLEVAALLLERCIVDISPAVSCLYANFELMSGESETSERGTGVWRCVCLLSDEPLRREVELINPMRFEAAPRELVQRIAEFVLGQAGWVRSEFGLEEWANESGFGTHRADPWFDDSGLPSEDVVGACQRLSERATEIAPGFVRSTYRIEVQALEPRWWYLNGGERIRVALVPNNVADDSQGWGWEGSPPGYGLDAVGAGLRVWSSFSLIEAMRQVTSHPEREVLYIFDEPERHLHPSAQREAASFVRTIVARGANVVVATHAPAFLNVRIPHSRLVRLSRVDGKTQAVSLGSGSLTEIERNATELGLTRADLIQLTRGVLLVEGSQDRLVVEEYFGEELADSYVRVLTLSGTHNSNALLDPKLRAQLGVPLFVMFDNTRASYCDALNKAETVTELPRSRTGEERRLRDLKERTLAHESSFTAVPLRVPDIAWAVPEQSVAHHHPAFPG